MPLFEFRCRQCSKRFTALVGVVARSKAPACPACGSGDLTKLMSRFGSPRSEDKVLDDLADIDKVGDMDDPKKIKKWIREMGKSMDEDMGDEIEEMFESEEDAGEASGVDDAIY